MVELGNLKESLRARKGTIALIIIIILVVAIFSYSYLSASEKTTIKISGAYALYPMMCIWADEYQKIHPHVKIEVSGGGAGKGMVDALAGISDIGMVSRDIYPEEIAKGAFFVSVCKDAVVATINRDNPVVNALMQKGVTQQEFVDIFITRKIRTWGELVGNPAIKDGIKVYTRADSCGAAQTWAEYLGNFTQEDLTNAADVAIMHDPDIALAVANDKLGIGYNNINFAYDFHTEKPVSGLRIAPIDLDGNGSVDANEDFYASRDEIVGAIAEGLYPSPPARALHLVTKHAFKGEVRDFVRWILTNGQEFIPGNGYIQLSESKIGAELQVLETGTRA